MSFLWPSSALLVTWLYWIESVFFMAHDMHAWNFGAKPFLICICFRTMNVLVLHLRLRSYWFMCMCAHLGSQAFCAWVAGWKTSEADRFSRLYTVFWGKLLAIQTAANVKNGRLPMFSGNSNENSSVKRRARFLIDSPWLRSSPCSGRSNGWYGVQRNCYTRCCTTVSVDTTW